MAALKPRSEQGHVVAGILLACLAFGSFATADAAAKFLSGDYAVLQILFLGSAFAFLPTLVFIWRLEGLASIWPQRPGLCLARGALTALSVLAIVWSFTMLPLAEGYALAFTAPLIVTALSGWLLQELASRRQWIAVLIGFLGVLVILRPGLSTVNAGHAAALGSAFLFALSLILLRRLGASETPGALLAAYFFVSLALYLPFLPGVWVTPADGFTWLLMVGIGIASGCGQAALVLAFRNAPAAIVSPFQYSQLIWGIAFGATLFGDRPDAVMLTGTLLVIGAGWALLSEATSRSP